MEKLSKNVLGFLFQYLDGKDLVRCERLNKKIYSGANQDYIWRYLCDNQLEFTTKFFGDSWKHCFWRNFKAQGHMTPDNFNYEMCPIRHFKSIVKYIETYQNFIFACDVNGNVGVFLISEKDLENDDETMKSESILTEGVEYLKYLPSSSQLLLVTTNGNVELYQIQQLGPDNFKIEFSHQQVLPMKTSDLYVTQLGENQTEFFISNYPLDGNNFMHDQTIHIYNVVDKVVTNSQTLDIGDEPHDNYLREAVQQIQAQKYQQIVNAQSFKDEKNNQQLAVYNGSKLVVSLFNKKLIILETKMSKLDLFLKKTNYYLFEPFDDNQTLAIDLKLFKGLLITNHIYQFNVFDYQTMTHMQNFKIQPGPNGLLHLNHHTDEIYFLRPTQQRKMQFYKFKVDFKTKKVDDTKYDLTESDESHLINDMDMSKHLYVSATTEGNIKLRRIADPKFDPYYLNAGSKSVKTYIQHPTKPGVSIVKLGQSKIVAVLGNVIRVYSFDIFRHKK